VPGRVVGQVDTRLAPQTVAGVKLLGCARVHICVPGPDDSAEVAGGVGLREEVARIKSNWHLRKLRHDYFAGLGAYYSQQ
jgi:hypothetical protein